MKYVKKLTQYFAYGFLAKNVHINFMY